MIYTWKVIAPMIISELAYNKPLPENMLNELAQNQGRFFFWKTIEKDAFKNSIMYRRVHDELMKKANDPNISENERLKLLRKAEGAKMKKERWKAQGVGTIIQNTAGPLLPIPGTTPMLMGAKKVFINNMDKTISRKRKENKQKYSRSAVIGDFLLEAYVDDDIDNDMLLYFYNDLM